MKKKNWKRWLALILAVSMLFGNTGIAMCTEQQESIDVKKIEKKEKISKGAEQKIIAEKSAVNTEEKERKEESAEDAEQQKSIEEIEEVMSDSDEADMKQVRIKKIPKIKLMYRTRLPYSEDFLQEIEWDSETDEDEMPDGIQIAELYEAIGNIIVVSDDKCTFEHILYNEEMEECYVMTTDTKYVFEEDTYVMDTELTQPLFDWICVPEIIQDKDISNQIQIAQGDEQIVRISGEWCNDAFLTANLKSTSKYFATEAYNAVTFYQCDDVKSWQDLIQRDMTQDNGKIGETQIKPDAVTEETFYELLFARDEAEWNYSTVAAIIRIIPEELFDEREDYTDEINGYPVITFGYDGTAPEVVFEKKILNRDKDSQWIGDTFQHIPEIVFAIRNKGFEVESLEYSFVNVTDCETVTEDEIKERAEDFISLTLTSNQQYKVMCPQKEGDYVLFVKAENEEAAETESITNRFFIDATSPEIQYEYGKEKISDRESDLTEAIRKGEAVYVDHTIFACYKIKEKHLKDVSVVITAKEYDQSGSRSVIAALLNPLRKKADEIARCLKEEQTAECDFAESGNYTITITVVDYADQTDTITHTFTVDKERPDHGLIQAAGQYHELKEGDNSQMKSVTLIAKKKKERWNHFFSNIVFNIFSEEEINITLEGSDRISPVQIYYIIADNEYTEEELQQLPENSWNSYQYTSGTYEMPVIAINRKGIVYEKVVDLAGNVSYFNSEGMITDNQAPTIHLQMEKAANKNGFYNADVSFSAYIEDQAAEDGTASAGLKYIAYRIEADSKDTIGKVVYHAEEDINPICREYHIENAVIPAEDFNSNQVKLYLTAIDHAGNKKEIMRELKMDTVKPKISVTYDDEPGAKYYNHKRTATISIKEKNLNPEDTTITITGTNGKTPLVGEWEQSIKAGLSEDVVYTCKVMFLEEDDYQFSVRCVDQAGNKAKNFSDAFTIDLTKPVITVKYSRVGEKSVDIEKTGNGIDDKKVDFKESGMTYYNGEVIATITITEHNFDEKQVTLSGLTEMEQNMEAGTGHFDRSKYAEAPFEVTGFTSEGDIHTVTVRYHKDGEYCLQVGCMDEAGNTAIRYIGNPFIIDRTSPGIEISNIEDKSANKGDVIPVITCTDTNYDREQVLIRVTGANHGDLNLNEIGYSESDQANGQEFKLDIPGREDMDDLYTLTVKVTDQAGNRAEKRIDFSVNRYGSVYTLGTESGEWLTNDQYTYIREGKPIVILETNVDTVVERNISYTLGGWNGNMTTIRERMECSAEERKKGMYYTVSERNTENQWYQYRYEIGADNFLQEGMYTVQINSTDQAGNHTSNVSQKHKDHSLTIRFAVDRTAPSVVLSGAENGAFYNEESHTVLLDVEDNLALDQVTVYLNKQEYGKYLAEEIAELENGLIPVVVKESLSVQTIQVVAKDKAGNILSKAADGEYDKKFDDFEILVTQNTFIRFLQTTQWLIVVLAIVICGISGLLILRHIWISKETRKG